VSYSRDSRPFVVGVVSVAHFLSHFYFLVFPPLFPLFSREFGVNNTQLGLLFSLLFLMPSVLQVPVGELVDRFGAKPLFVLGIAVTSLGTMATTLATSYLALLGFVLLAGVGQSAFHPADFALLETVTDPTSRGKSFGAHTFAGYLGFAAGPLVAGLLGVRYGWRAALGGLGVIGLCYAVAVFVALPTVHRGREGAVEAAEAGSGGLLSKGHPLGATGLAQCTELVWHLRGEAGERQVDGAQVALQHNLGLGGACVITMYRRD